MDCNPIQITLSVHKNQCFLGAAVCINEATLKIGRPCQLTQGPGKSMNIANITLKVNALVNMAQGGCTFVIRSYGAVQLADIEKIIDFTGTPKTLLIKWQ